MSDCSDVANVAKTRARVRARVRARCGELRRMSDCSDVAKYYVFLIGKRM